MANHRNRFPARRRFLKQSTALTASVVALPHLARAQAIDEPAAAPVTKGTAAARQAADSNSAPLSPRPASSRRTRDPKP